MFGLPKEVVGAIAAALLAGLVSLLGLIISKEQKISEFRQSWIDQLRSDIASAITHLLALRARVHEARPNRPSVADCKEHYIAINQAITCIRLRLNPDEEDNRALLASLDKIEKVHGSGTIDSSEELIPEIEILTTKARGVMKREWERVRSGELMYRITLYAVIAAFLLIAGIAIRAVWLQRR
jgi:hypothetical protein